MTKTRFYHDTQIITKARKKGWRTSCDGRFTFCFAFASFRAFVIRFLVLLSMEPVLLLESLGVLDFAI